MFESGLFTIGHWRGVPIRVHWSALLGAFVFGGLRFAPGAWVGFFVIVVLHELGHAWLVKRRKLQAVAVHVHGFGGECRYTGHVTALDRAIVAWGGVMAQTIVLAIAGVVSLLLPPVTGAFVRDLMRALIVVNVLIIALNLLPFRPLDGHEAWKLPGLLKRRRGAKRDGRGSGGGRGGRGGGRSGGGKRAGGRKRASTPPVDPEREAERVAREAIERARGKRKDGTG